MTRPKKTFLSLAIPVFMGAMFLLSFVNTCERFPELALEVTTDSIESLPGREYKLIGTIESFGQEPVTQHGFCWAETTNPTKEGSATQLGNKTAKGGFTSIISKLSANTLFYVRAYAITETGTAYGEEKTFTTPTPSLATITTSEISNITTDSAQSGGTIIDDGGSEITARGVCWDTIPNPTSEDWHTSNKSDTSTFTGSITGLDCSTEYYVRAYATNAAGTAYGNEESFTSASCTAGLPNVTTATISSITHTSAQGGGNVSDEGNSSVTARGVCWSESSNPTISDSHTTDEAGLGAYTSSISGLTANTTYYVRAYATNDQGTGYGDEESFNTLTSTGETVTDYDGNEYNTIQIGEQVWMKENLKTTKYNDGTAIPLVTDLTTWNNSKNPGYCWYNNDEATYKATYGALYNWYVVNTGKLCPTGWHIPSHDEWTILTTYLGGETVAGGKLKETGTFHWINPNVGATNESGFTALPGGSRDSSSGFDFIGYLGYWWSSNEYSSTNARNLTLYGDFSGVYKVYDNKKNGFSVRCVIDDVTSSLPTITTISASNITASSVQTGGEVVTDGGASVTARGVCWSISENPTLSDEFTTEGSGIGIFTSTIIDLDCNTTYYIRAYATNSVGTAYGSQVNFTTSQCSEVSLPTVTTSYLSNITTTSAIGGGEVIDDGGDSIIARGVCWRTSQNPTLSDTYTTDGTGSGSFTSNITGLVKSTTYYVRAYATNSAGSAYGQEIILKTNEGTVTDFDGNVYPTVTIGAQTWMQQNLKVTHYEDGTSIPLVEDFTEWVLLGYEDKAFSWYNNSTTYRDIYGGLYTWAAIMNDEASSTTNPSGIQGVCPDGWHIPSDEEWKQLERHLGMSEAIADASDWRGTDEGGKLKETGVTHWANPNEGATNESAFTALPGGARYPDNGASGYESYLGSWWTSTEYGSSHAWGRFLDYNNSKILRIHDTKEFGFSVRCLKD